jgi:type III secretion system needle length determinant
MIDPAKIGHNAESTILRPGALSSAEAEGKRDEFHEAMRQNEGKGEAGSKGQETGRRLGTNDEKNESPLPPPFSGDALLRGLGDSYAPVAVTPGLLQDASALATELADRILVNTDSRVAGGEVRIILKDSVLPDTEIILRQEGERLVVQLVSGNSASLDALRQAQNDLRNKLLALDSDISVEVLDNRAREDGGESGHPGGRSRGLNYFTENES